MGAIKNISDQVIINNESELITPAIVRQVNDVIDAQVENVKGKVSILEVNVTNLQTNLSTTNTQVNTLSQTITNLGNTASGIPNGGVTGQVLSKKTNTDKDIEWVNPPVTPPLPSGGTTGQVLAKASSTDRDVAWVTLTAGKDGINGTNGINGINGQNGQDGQSAYEIWLNDGNEGSESEFLASLGGGGNFLPLSGGSMNGNINMSAYKLYVNRIEKNNFGGVPSAGITMGINYLVYSSPHGYGMQYDIDYSATYTDRTLVDKGYVDSKKPKKYKQDNIIAGADPLSLVINHNLNSTDLLINLEEAGTGKIVNQMYYTTPSDPQDQSQAFDPLNNCRVVLPSDETWNVTIIAFMD